MLPHLSSRANTRTTFSQTNQCFCWTVFALMVKKKIRNLFWREGVLCVNPTGHYGNPLNKYIRHYEGLSYDTDPVDDKHQRVKRALSHEDKFLHLDFHAHGRYVIIIFIYFTLARRHNHQPGSFHCLCNALCVIRVTHALREWIEIVCFWMSFLCSIAGYSRRYI